MLREPGTPMMGDSGPLAGIALGADGQATGTLGQAGHIRAMIRSLTPKKARCALSTCAGSHCGLQCGDALSLLTTCMSLCARLQISAAARVACVPLACAEW